MNDQPEPADQAAVRSLALLADKLVERCPDHGCVEPEWEEGCHCEVVPLLPRLADEAQQPAAGEQPDTRRDRYAAAINETSGWVLDGGQHMVDAVMAVADEEQQEMANATVAFTAAIRRQNDNLRTMYDVSERRVHDLIEERDRLHAELEQARATTLVEAADALRDMHFTHGMSVQEIGTAFRHMASAARDRATTAPGVQAEDGAQQQ